MIILKYTQKFCIFTLLVLVFGMQAAYSSEKNHDRHAGEAVDHQEDESKENHEEDAGFELSPKAIKLMQIETAPIKLQKSDRFILPYTALVSYGEEYGVYRFDGEHFELINLTNIKKEKSAFNFKSDLLKKGDLIVIKGAPLLRVAHLQASGQGGEGHGH